MFSHRCPCQCPNQTSCSCSLRVPRAISGYISFCRCYWYQVTSCFSQDLLDPTPKGTVSLSLRERSVMLQRMSFKRQPERHTTLLSSKACAAFCPVAQNANLPKKTVSQRPSNRPAQTGAEVSLSYGYNSKWTLVSFLSRFFVSSCHFPETDPLYTVFMGFLYPVSKRYPAQ